MTIGESVTLKLNATANRLRQEGEPVIHLGGGEPKSKAPREAVATACDLLETGEIRYAPADGIHALKTVFNLFVGFFWIRLRRNEKPAKCR